MMMLERRNKKREHMNTIDCDRQECEQIRLLAAQANHTQVEHAELQETGSRSNAVRKVDTCAYLYKK
jgi:hypothetical protein